MLGQGRSFACFIKQISVTTSAYLLAVGNDADLDAAFVGTNDGVGKMVVGDGVDTDIQRLLGAIQSLDKLLEALF